MLVELNCREEKTFVLAKLSEFSFTFNKSRKREKHPELFLCLADYNRKIFLFSFLSQHFPKLIMSKKLQCNNFKWFEETREAEFGAETLDLS